MYYDHEFEGDQNQPCKASVMVYNPEFDHDPIDKWLEIDATDEFGYPLSGRVDLEAPCQECNRSRDDVTHKRRKIADCGAPWTSVLHPPDQFRHWCSTLEAGGDCMHMEDY